jgi:hypothetical protein
MGIYNTLSVIYGCSLSFNVDKVKNIIKTLKINEKNFLFFEDHVFLIIPRINHRTALDLDQEDIENNYVKMSKIISYTKLKKEDLTPTEEELLLFTSYLKQFTTITPSESKLYAVSVGFSTYELPKIEYFMCKYLPIIE